ncbi:MAG TPA: rhodanese-like domain-containing protein [Candidatus Sulfotelmatobacter sp.]|jgi:hydroxyacylglutathione hydrolase|nr:rhodanese-like domain-containing protein [Candidatus Sulfotelmatobacter sp.]
MLKDQPARPANMESIVAINQGKLPYAMRDPEAPALAPDAAERLLADGVWALDARSQDAFGAGHVPGAVNVPSTSSSFEQWAGWVLPPERRLILVLDARTDARGTLRRLAIVGLDQRIVGLLDPAAWRDAGKPLASLPQIGVSELVRRIARNDLRVLDVRERSEWDAGHIDPSLQLSFKVLPAAFGDFPLRPDDPVAVVCASGARSSIAASVLLRNGYRSVWNVSGGLQAWQGRGLPIVTT